MSGQNSINTVIQHADGAWNLKEIDEIAVGARDVYLT